VSEAEFLELKIRLTDEEIEECLGVLGEGAAVDLAIAKIRLPRRSW